jgi:hypothetical protein
MKHSSPRHPDTVFFRTSCRLMFPASSPLCLLFRICFHAISLEKTIFSLLERAVAEQSAER